MIELLFESLAALLLAAAGVFLVALGVKALKKRRAMKRWPKRAGVVREGRLYSRRRHHRAQFLVSYVPERKEYVTLCDSPTRSGYTEPRGAEADLARHPPGSEVEVMVNPRKPGEAYLYLPEAHMILALLLGGALLIFLGLFALAGITGLAD